MTSVEHDTYQQEIPHRLPIESLRSLSRINPWRSTAHIVLEWVGIAAAIWLCSTHWHPALYVLTLMWIGARQHALGILMHDGAHYRLYESKRANELVGEILLSWPLFFSMRSYRSNHFAHHRNLNTDDDPDWVRKLTKDWIFPKKWPALMAILLKDLLGFSTVRLVKEMSAYSKVPGRDDSKQQLASARVFKAARLGFYATAAILFTVLHLWTAFLLFWLVPAFTWFLMVLRIRSIAEHYSLERDHPYTQSRTTYPSVFERLFVASKNVGYHLEHHLYPSVPFYNLPKLHAHLMRAEGYRGKAHVTRTYLGVLRECLPGSQRLQRGGVS